MSTALIGDNSTDDYAGTEDAMIASVNPTYNYGAGNTLFIYEETGDIIHSLLKFSGLSNISSPVTVSSASLYIYYNNLYLNYLPIIHLIT